MKRNTKAIVLTIFLATTAFCQNLSAQTPRVFLMDAKNLAEAKQKILAGDKNYVLFLAKLKSDAQKALKTENLSIVNKDGTPPSNDKHDYMSQAPYFWKNPNTPNGLPYVRRDGERNPEIKKFPDHETLDEFVKSVRALSLAFYFTNDETYAAKATQLLRAWFVEPKTKMNPNMNFAQAVPGESAGRVFGVLESRGLTGTVDSIGLLDGSKSFTKDDKQAVKNWFAQFLDWLTTSKNGRGESNSPNNHGTLYDVQVVSYALFLDKNDLAKTVLETAKQKRIARQIAPDGAQSLELERTKSWNYSTMNLEGLMWLAKLGETANVDLWNYKTADGRSIRKAIEYLYPFAVGNKKWEHEQIEGFEPQRLFRLLRRATIKYQDNEFRQMFLKVPATDFDANDF